MVKLLISADKRINNNCFSKSTFYTEIITIVTLGRYIVGMYTYDSKFT